MSKIELISTTREEREKFCDIAQHLANELMTLSTNPRETLRAVEVLYSSVLQLYSQLLDVDALQLLEVSSLNIRNYISTILYDN